MGNSSSHSAPFTPSSPSILVTTLWHLSLALSLTSWVFALMAKLWLHAYTQGTTMPTSSADAALLQRNKTLEIWKTRAISTFIHHLFQLSIALFLVGMVIHLFTLPVNSAAAGLSAVTIVIVLIFAYCYKSALRGVEQQNVRV
ncbi:hypothetical protein OG21DRAFT_605695 [Imleria badia]|nr:hypothetical protein OG21DRAFT_605695 [Imleria badia]